MPKYKIYNHSNKASGLLVRFVLVVAVGASVESCFFETATFVCEAGLHCRPGQICDVAQDACIDIGGCGDGHVTGDEVCDDGNVSDMDGCSRDCKSDETC